jgi:hypothetical protein
MNKYIVCRHTRYFARQAGRIEIASYDNKKAALTAASNLWKLGTPSYVYSCKTNQLTYILPRDRCSCHVCGNELEGKKHCPLCNALHYYT